MSDEDTERLLSKATERFGVKPHCMHPNTTLVQHIDPEYGWFVAYQCDDCGQLTRREVSAGDLDDADRLPWLDVAMYERATTERAPQETLGRALAFFGKAAK